MSFGGFWKNVGLGFAKVGKGAAAGALWASQHPEVIGAVAAISGHAEVIPIINAASGVVGNINRSNGPTQL